MLAHLQHLDLSALLKDLNMCHIFLLHLLDCNLHASFYLRCHFNESELSFAECLLKGIVIKHIGVAQDSLQSFGPHCALGLGIEVNVFGFVCWDSNCQLKELCRTLLFHVSFDEATSEVEHLLVDFVCVDFEEVNFVALQRCVVRLQRFFLLEVALAIK